MKRDRSILLDKSEAFGSRIIKMYQYLTNVKKESVISKQVLRSGTSIGANVSESRNAQSKADFISKLSIALKEADETSFWIKSLYEGGYIKEKEFQAIHDDCVELIKILVSSIKTLKRKVNTPQE